MILERLITALGAMTLAYMLSELSMNLARKLDRSGKAKFLVQILTDDFKSHDLHLLGRNLRKEREEENRIEIFDNLNEVSVTKNLMEILEILKNSKEEIYPEDLDFFETELATGDYKATYIKAQS